MIWSRGLAVVSAGVIASVCLIMLSLTVKRINIVVLTLVLSVACIVQFIGLGKHSSAAISIVMVVYIIAGFMVKSPVVQSPFVVGCVMGLYCLVYVLVNGFEVSIELLALVASCAGLLVVVFDDQVRIKVAQFSACVLWTIFTVAIGAWGQLLGQIFTLIFSCITMVYVMRYVSTNGRDSTVPELIEIFRDRARG